MRSRRELNLYVLSFVVVFLTFICTPISAQCPDGSSLTFSRTAGYEPQLPMELPVLYSSTYGSAITAECYNRCREQDDCTGFIVNYAKATCNKVILPMGSLVHFVEAPGVAYYIKECLPIPSNCTLKAWSFETVPGYTLYSEPFVEIQNITDRAGCMEVCLNSTEELCLSANYFPDTQICALLSHDRWDAPDLFVPAIQNGFEYLENGCLQGPRDQVCWKLPSVNKFSVRADLRVANATKEECSAKCAGELSFRCLAYSFVGGEDPEEGDCLLHSDAILSPGLGSLLLPTLQEAENAEYVEAMPCLNLTVSCDQEHMNVTLYEEGFAGRMSVSGRSGQCYAPGKGSEGTTLSIPIPTSDNIPNECNVQLMFALGPVNRTRASVVLIIQKNSLIERAGDWAVKANCFLTDGEAVPSTNNITIGAGFHVGPPTAQTEVSGEWGAPVGNLSLPRARMSLIDARTGKPSPVVNIGDPLILRIELFPPYTASMVRPHTLIATSGDSVESIFLLDPNGCPTDPTTFSGFVPTKNDTLECRFRGFRFPRTSSLGLQIMLTFFNTAVEPVKCEHKPKPYSRGKRSIPNALEATTSTVIEELPLELSIVVNPPSGGDNNGAILQASLGGYGLDSNHYCMSFLTASLALLFFVLLQSSLLTFVCIAFHRRNKEKAPESDTVSLGRDFDLSNRHVTFADDVLSYPRPELRLSTPMKT